MISPRLPGIPVSPSSTSLTPSGGFLTRSRTSLNTRASVRGGRFSELPVVANDDDDDDCGDGPTPPDDEEDEDEDDVAVLAIGPAPPPPPPWDETLDARDPRRDGGFSRMNDDDDVMDDEAARRREEEGVIVDVEPPPTADIDEDRTADCC